MTLRHTLMISGLLLLAGGCYSQPQSSAPAPTSPAAISYKEFSTPLFDGSIPSTWSETDREEAQANSLPTDLQPTNALASFADTVVVENAPNDFQVDVYSVPRTTFLRYLAKFPKASLDQTMIAGPAASIQHLDPNPLGRHASTVYYLPDIGTSATLSTILVRQGDGDADFASGVAHFLDTLTWVRQP